MQRRGALPFIVEVCNQPWPEDGMRPFADAPRRPNICRMNGITLTPELEQFATEAVAAGRYRDMSDVVQAGVALLKQAEAEMAAFIAPLEEARAEGERDGCLTAEEVHREMAAMLDDMTRAKASASLRS